MFSVTMGKQGVIVKNLNNAHHLPKKSAYQALTHKKSEPTYIKAQMFCAFLQF